MTVAAVEDPLVAPETHAVEILPIHRFKLSDKLVTPFASKRPDWGPLGEVTYRRTYSREIVDTSGLKLKTRQEEWFETIRRVVEGAYTYQKWHCKQHGLPWSEKKAQASAQEMYGLIFDMKFLPPGRGLWMCGTEYVERVGSAALNNCLAYETEFITAEGIKKIGDCAGSEQTVLTTGGKWVAAPIRSFGLQRLMRVVIARQGVQKEIYATADHRWFAVDRRTAYRGKGYVEFNTSALRSGHRLQYVFGQGIAGAVRPSPFGIAHGVTFGDGTTVPGTRNANRVVLCGDKAELRRYFNRAQSRELPDLCEGGAVEVTDVPNGFRQLPAITENKSYLYGWLAGYFATDGSVSKDGTAKITSSDRANIEFVRSVCAVLGIGAYGIRKDSSVSNLTGQSNEQYSVTLMRATLESAFFIRESHRAGAGNIGEIGNRYWNVVTVEETDRIEEVFCATVDGYGKFALADNILTGNCAFVSTANIDKDFADPFCFLMDFSMLGVGVGGDTRGAGKLTVKSPVVDGTPHVVADTREGWVELIRRVLNCYAGKATYPVHIDTSKVRPAGEPIKGFGGISAGPEPLLLLVEGIKSTLAPLIGTPITSSAIVDLFNKVGVCVVAGNVRRSAEILLGEPDDEVFANLKNYEMFPAEVKSHRWASNNSIFAAVGMDYVDHAERTAMNGEPGYFWIETARAYGRMMDAPTWADKNIAGTNPCSEQSLEDHELCCLVETFPSRHDDFDEYRRTLKFAYLYAKSITLVPTHNPTVNARVMRNRRIGCSQSGIIDSFAKHGKREHLNWCNDGYRYLRNLDQSYSDWLCVPLSKKITSVKPSGTVSLLPGVSPGIHYPHAQFYFRTMRLSKISPLATALDRAGYRIEPSVTDQNTVVVYFPVKERHFDRSKDDVTMWEQLENAAALQHYWADNQVSVTVTFRKDEAKDIRHALELYDTRLKSVSFLPISEHGYAQAPYQTITEAEYEAAAKRVKPINFKSTEHEATDAYCDGDVCVVPQQQERYA